eukprot:9472882-Alexandrium_andersonii.AAC.1
MPSRASHGWRIRRGAGSKRSSPDAWCNPGSSAHEWDVSEGMCTMAAMSAKGGAVFAEFGPPRPRPVRRRRGNAALKTRTPAS